MCTRVELDVFFAKTKYVLIKNVWVGLDQISSIFTFKLETNQTDDVRIGSDRLIESRLK